MGKQKFDWARLRTETAKLNKRIVCILLGNFAIKRSRGLEKQAVLFACLCRETVHHAGVLRNLPHTQGRGMIWERLEVTKGVEVFHRMTGRESEYRHGENLFRRNKVR